MALSPQLVPILNQTALQQTDPKLYQVILGLITNLTATEKAVVVAGTTGGGGTVINNTTINNSLVGLDSVYSSEDGLDALGIPGPAGNPGTQGVNGSPGVAAFLIAEEPTDPIDAIPGIQGIQGPKGDTGASAGELDYVEFTSAVNPTATTEATANTIVTGSSIAYDGSTTVIIEFFCQNARPDTGAANRQLTYVLYDGSSSIGFIGLQNINASGGINVPVHLVRRITPSNASHTYSIRAFVNAGTALVQAGAGGAGTNAPGFIRITKA
jgi:hypothetical protein